MSVEVVDPEMKPGKIKKLIGLLGKLIIAAVLIGGGFAGGYVYFAKPFSPAQDMLRLIEPEAAAQAEAAASGEMPEKVVKEMPETDLFVTSYFTFPDVLTSNMLNSKSFLQVQVGVSTQYDAQVITNVETHKLALQSDMLAVMATFTAEDLAGTAGRKRLADALKDAVNERLKTLEGFGGVEDVFFPSFMMQ
jgi:flagellar FliL protein